MVKILTKKYILLLFKVLITTLFFVLILNKVDLNSTIVLLRKTNATFFVLALAIMIIEVLIANVRWQVILNQLGIIMPYFLALRYLWVGVFCFYPKFRLSDWETQISGNVAQECAQKFEAVLSVVVKLAGEAMFAYCFARVHI